MRNVIKQTYVECDPCILPYGGMLNYINRSKNKLVDTQSYLYNLL